ncbi:MAG: ATP-binding cassette domain-containing protein, partial [Chitinophagaceae bacterium]
MESVIQTTALDYHYSRKVQTLYDIELAMERGSVYGFLGPNGSGKTTTLRLLLGLLNNQKGEIRVFGKPLQADRIAILKKIGSLIEHPSLYGHLSARQNLEIYLATYGATSGRVQEVLRIADLMDTGSK